MSTLSVDFVVHRGPFVLEAAFAVAEGERVAVIGPNGAGKTTALRAIAGLTPITHGHIQLGKTTLADGVRAVPPEGRRVAVAFADRRLFPHMSAHANVAFAARAAGANRPDAARVAGEWLDRLEVGPLAARRPDQLSSGQAQRVALARALAQNAAALLLDEPTSALDAETRALVRHELNSHLQHVRVPTVLVTHDPREAAELADRVVVLEAGAIAQMATPRQLAANPATDYVRRFLAGHG